MLALWIRKAVQAGGRLVVVGPSNGLYRDTSAWLRCEAGQEAAVLDGLLVALAGGPNSLTGSAAERIAAALGQNAAAALDGAAVAFGARPTTVLAHPGVAADLGARELLERLAVSSRRAGVVACSERHRSARMDAEHWRSRLASPGSIRSGPGLLRRRRLEPLLLIGDEPWPDTGAARLVLATSVLPAAETSRCCFRCRTPTNR